MWVSRIISILGRFSIEWWSKFRILVLEQRYGNAVYFGEGVRLGLRNKIYVSPESRLVVKSGVVILGSIELRSRSRLKIGRDSFIHGELVVQKDSSLALGAMVRCNNDLNRIFVNNQSKVKIKEASLLGLSGGLTMSVDWGKVTIEKMAKINGTVSVRFGGRLTIGMYTGFGQGSEIICDEEIKIGKYCLVSTNVCVYDTATHELDWKIRRKRIKASWPKGLKEPDKPGTLPISIGDDVWLGKESSIFRGAKIGNGVIVGLRTFVGRGKIADGSTVVGAKSRILSVTQTI